MNEEINMTRDTVRGALDVANASVLTLHELRQVNLNKVGIRSELHILIFEFYPELHLGVVYCAQLRLIS